MPELLSRKAYCRRRGCDPSSLRYAIQQGWVRPDPATGMIDPTQADRGWPLDRLHGPRAWVMGPAVGPPTEFETALVAGDLGRAMTLLTAEPTPEVELEALLKGVA